MKLEEVKFEIQETTAELKRKKSFLTKIEKERKQLVQKVQRAQERLLNIDAILKGRTQRYKSEKEYPIPNYRFENRMAHKVVAKVKYSGLYEDVKALEEQLAVLKELKGVCEDL